MDICTVRLNLWTAWPLYSSIAFFETSSTGWKRKDLFTKLSDADQYVVEYNMSTATPAVGDHHHCMIRVKKAGILPFQVHIPLAPGTVLVTATATMDKSPTPLLNEWLCDFFGVDYDNQSQYDDGEEYPKWLKPRREP